MFSVLMSIYIKENPLYLKESIKSIFNQSLMPVEVVLVKDGPLTDELNSVIDEFELKYPTIVVIISLKENVGLGMALKQGLMACSYEYVARMDSDDVNHYRRFELQYNFLKKNKDIDILGSNISEFHNTIDVETSARIVEEHHDDIVKVMKYKSAINHVTVMFKKEAVISSGSYQSFKIEDYHLWVRMIIKGCKFHNLKEKLVYVRIGNDMIGRRSGLTYFKLEYKLLKFFYHKKFINFGLFSFLVLIKFIIRTLPKKVLERFYFLFMRSKTN